MKTLNKMNLQYITEDAVAEFINKMEPLCTSTLMEDPGVESMLKGNPPKTVIDDENPLGTMECFLQLFIDREEFEICQTLIEQYPELKF